MEYALYALAMGITYYSLTLLAQAKWSLQSPDAWFACYMMFGGIVIAAFGQVIDLLRRILTALQKQ